MEKRFRAVIRGEVQGVGFRYFLRREALRLGLFGFAKNEPDGSVCAEAQGEEKNLEIFLELCRKGPSFSSVGGVFTEEIPLVAEAADFVVE